MGGEWTGCLTNPSCFIGTFPFMLLHPRGEFTPQMGGWTVTTIPVIQRKLIFQFFFFFWSGPIITIYFVQYNFSVSGMDS